MTDKYYVGIDPGSKGAIAVLHPDGTASVIDMPTLENVLDNPAGIKMDKTGLYRVAIESVHAMPGQSCTAMFTYGENFLLAKLIGLCYNSHPVMVSPQKWKNYYGLKRDKGESKTVFKKKSIELAKKLFPDIADSLTASKDGRAEALLIAKWLKDTDETESDTTVHKAKKQSKRSNRTDRR